MSNLTNNTKPKLPSASPKRPGWIEEYPDLGLISYEPHEPLERYVAGGFHPTSLGDSFCEGRYTIRHRLGHGGFSSVWLAHDGHEDRWVSIKIKQAYVSANDVEQDPDVKALTALEKHHASTSTKSPRCFPQLFDCFHHSGPNGKHTCIVTELLGPSLGVVLKSYSNDFIDLEPDVFRPDSTLRASRQLLEAVQFCHSAGLVHGDISPTNLTFTCNQAFMSDEDFWDTLGGEPVVIKYEGPEPRPPNLPKELVRKTTWSGWYDNPHEDICLIDWGESFPVSETPPVSDVVQNPGIKSPESIFQSTLDFRHDLWGAGCVVFTMFYQRYPFHYPSSEIDHVKHMCQVLGPLPPTLEAWLKDKKEIESTLNSLTLVDLAQEESHLLVHTFEPRRQEVVAHRQNDEFYEKSDFDEEDFEALKCLLLVIKGLMQFEPHNRLSAQDAYDSIAWIDYSRGADVKNSGEGCDDCH